MPSSASTQKMVNRLDQAVQADCFKTITSGVKDALIELTKSGALKLDEDSHSLAPILTVGDFFTMIPTDATPLSR